MRSERGAVMLEATLALPIMLLFMFSLLSLSISLFKGTKISDAVLNAARRSAVSTSSCSDILEQARENLVSNVAGVGITVAPQSMESLFIDIGGKNGVKLRYDSITFGYFKMHHETTFVLESNQNCVGAI